jgi:hypothetical protein
MGKMAEGSEYRAALISLRVAELRELAARTAFEAACEQDVWLRWLLEPLHRP